MVLVDSSVWIEALRREGRLDVKLALECLLEEYEAAWCGTVKLEVLGGARQRDREKLETHFSCIPYLQMKDAAWESAKKSRVALAGSGLCHAVERHFDRRAVGRGGLPHLQRGQAF